MLEPVATRDATAMSSQALQLETSPRSLQLDKSLHHNEDPAQSKIKNKFKKGFKKEMKG